MADQFLIFILSTVYISHCQSCICSKYIVDVQHLQLTFRTKCFTGKVLRLPTYLQNFSTLNSNIWYTKIMYVRHFYVTEAIKNNPFDLSFLLWVAMCKGERGTGFIVLCIQQLFPHMKTNTNKLSSRCDVDTLCRFDMEVSTYLALVTN